MTKINRVLHTPDGFRDRVGASMTKKLELMERLSEVFGKYGCTPIETPTVEFFDVFSSGIGTTPSSALYKFFDRDGNTLVLRPDFTPSVARAAAMYTPEEAFPAIYSYSGSTFVNSAEYEGIYKESTQMGAECFGDGSPEEDAKMLALTCELLLAAGIEEFQISIGQVDYFKGLMETSPFGAEETERIRALVSGKNTFELRDFLKMHPAGESIETALLKLPMLFGRGGGVLEKARELAMNERQEAAVTRLEEIRKILVDKGLESYVGFDLALLSKYNYYTGIVFSALTYGAGEPLARGGRYDDLMGYFGKSRPAVGVGVFVDRILD